MKAIEDKAKTRAVVVVNALATGLSLAMPGEGQLSAGLAAALKTLADDFRAEAELWTKSQRKGWQSTSTQLRQVASRVAAVGVDVGKLVSTTRIKIETPDSMLTEENRADARDELMDYLRGDTDTPPADLAATVDRQMQATPLPSADPAPETPRDALDRSGVDKVATLNEEAKSMTQTFPIDPVSMMQIVNGPAGPAVEVPAASLPDGDFQDPRPMSELMVANRYAPPTGDMLLPTFASLLTPPPSSKLPGHWSWSQLETSENCGLQYRLDRIEQYTRIPQWANIGGDAFHRATDAIDYTRHQTGAPYPSNESVIDNLWNDTLNAIVGEIAAASPVPATRWRVSNGGKENYDWWRVEGAAMLRRWCALRTELAAVANPRKLAMLPNPNGPEHEPDDRNHALAVEWPFNFDVPGPLGTLRFEGIADRVWQCADGSMLVEDLKSGYRIPKDTGQLGSQAWGVVHSGAVGKTHTRIMGVFYDARRGVWTPAVDLLAAHPWDELVYRLHTAEAKRRTGLYSPHVTDLCVACSVNYACPLRNRAGGAS